MTITRSAEGGACFRIFLPAEGQELDPRQEEGFLERVFDMEKTWEKMLVAG